MSVANQANEKLTQLVSLTAKIESYLNPNSSKKKEGSEGADKKDGGNKTVKSKVEGADAGPRVNTAEEAIAIGGMAGSLSKLILATKILSPKAGSLVKGFLIDFSEGLKEAGATLKEVDGVKLIEALTGMSKGLLHFAIGMTAIAILAPAVALGTLVFALSLKMIIWSLKDATAATAKGASGIETIVNLGKSLIWFALAMVAIAVTAPLYAVGVLLFVMSIKAIIWSLKDATAATGKGASGIETITKLGSALIWFALAMVLIAVTAPLYAVGVLLFVLSIKAILWSLKSANAASGKGANQLESLLKLGKSVMLFALTMVGIALLAPLYIVGVLLFVLSIKAILWAMKDATAATTKGTNSIVALMKIAKGVMLFALTMIAIGYFVDKFAIGTLAFVLSISAIMFVLKEVGKNSLMINRGIKSMNSMVKPLLLFGVTMALAGLVYVQIALGAVVLGLAIGFISIVMNEVGKKATQINKGVKTLGSMAKPLVLFGGVMALAGLVWKEILKGSAALAAAMVVIGLAAYGLGKFDKDIKKGSVVLDSLIAPMIGFAVGVAIVGSLIKDDPVTLGLKLVMVGAAIVGLGLAAYVLGNPAVALFAEIGAGVLLTLAASLVVFAGALWVLSKADFTKEKTENLAYAIAQIGISLAKFGLVAIPAAIGAAVLIPASLALLPLTGALAIFKTIGWTQADGDSLVNALTSTVQGFAHALDGVGMMGMVKLLAAIPIIALIGGALVSLAVGVKSMATLSFTEMEYDKATHKLIPKRVVKLTDAEIQAVGPNTAMILNALAMPLTNFGMWSTMGETGFGPFTIGAGYMAKGIKAAAGIGNVIASIAKGVSDMAQLNVVDYEVRDGKLVPKAVRKLNAGDFLLASLNTSLILSTLQKPLTEFGMWASAGEGALWGDGYTVKGIQAAGKIGNAIASIAKGVADMANLSIVDYAVVDGKLVPTGTPRKLGAEDFTLAADNVGLILTTLTQPLTQFGKDYKNGSSWFTDSALEAGLDAAGKVTDPISKMADMVLKLAGGQATINEVINPGTKDAKLVAKGVISFADAVPMAIENAKKLLYAFPQVFANLGIYIDKYEDEIDTAIEFMPKMSSASKDILDVSKSYLGIVENVSKANAIGVEPIWPMIHFSERVGLLGVFLTGLKPEQFKTLSKATESLKDVSTIYVDIVKNIGAAQKLKTNPNPTLLTLAGSIDKIGSSFTNMNADKLVLYKKFASITEGMTKINTPFEKFAKTFGQFTKEMGSFVKIWDKFGKDDATNLKSYADSLKAIASVDPGKLSATTKALKEQAQAQADLNNAQKKSPDATATGKTENKSILSKVVDKATEVLSGGATDKKAPGPESTKNSNVPGSGGIVAEMHVTTLYINGKKF